MRTKILIAVALTASIVTGGLKASGYQVEETFRSPAAIFTAKQAAAGKAAYAKDCSSCHLPDLSGENEIPALAGAPFKATWGPRSTKELYDYMSAAMPYGGASLSAESYTTILAYILEFNGAVAGADPLTATTGVPIGSVTSARAAVVTPLP